MDIRKIIREEISNTEEDWEWTNDVPTTYSINDLEVGMVVVPLCPRHRLIKPEEGYKVERVDQQEDRLYVHFIHNVPLTYPYGEGKHGLAPKLTINSTLDCTFYEH